MCDLNPPQPIVCPSPFDSENMAKFAEQVEKNKKTAIPEPTVCLSPDDRDNTAKFAEQWEKDKKAAIEKFTEQWEKDKKASIEKFTREWDIKYHEELIRKHTEEKMKQSKNEIAADHVREMKESEMGGQVIKGPPMSRYEPQKLRHYIVITYDGCEFLQYMDE